VLVKKRLWTPYSPAILIKRAEVCGEDHPQDSLSCFWTIAPRFDEYSLRLLCIEIPEICRNGESYEAIGKMYLTLLITQLCREFLCC